MNSLEILVDGLFDYAGMFPPAALGYEEAVAESARADSLRRPHMVAADLVLKQRWIEHLARNRPDAFDRPVRVCWVGLTHEDVVEAAKEAAVLPKHVEVVSLEFTASPARAAEALAAAAAETPPGARLYWEPAWRADEWSDLDEAWPVLEEARSNGADIGLKFRCAGPNAVDHGTLSDIIEGAAEHEIPLKATQGLHHPFAGDDRYDNDHGFLNVVVGLRLAQTVELSGLKLRSLLRDDDESSFIFDEGLGWKRHRVSVQRLQDATRTVPFSIGTCSLAEPDDDLKRLYG